MTDQNVKPGIGPVKDDPRHPSARAAPQAAQKRLRERYWDRNRLLTVSSLVLVLVFPGVFFGLVVYAFLGIMMVPTVLALGLILWKDKAWSYLTVGILGSLFPIMVLMFMGVLEGQIANPLVALQFSASMIMIFSLVLLWSGVVPGFRHRRAKGLAAHRAAPANRVQPVLVLVAAALLVGAMGTSFGAESQAVERIGGGYDFTPDASVSVAVVDFEFVPQQIAIEQGVITEIVVENQDREPHTFTYERDGVLYDHELPRHATQSFLVLFDEVGTFDYWCVPHSDGAEDDGDGMVGTLQVTAAS